MRQLISKINNVEVTVKIIKERFDELIYPDETFIKKDFIKGVINAEKFGVFKIYKSADEFFGKIEKCMR